MVAFKVGDRVSFRHPVITQWHGVGKIFQISTDGQRAAILIDQDEELRRDQDFIGDLKMEWLTAIDAVVTDETCPECFGTGLRGGSHLPCSLGCDQ